MTKNWIQTTLTIIILFGITTMLYLYTSGYRLNRSSSEEELNVKVTGMIGAKSIPEGANIYVNGELMNATDATVPALEPGKYELKIAKNGFVPWAKEVEVYKELVTDITAVLISQSPRLEPLTNTGARFPTISPTLSKLAFFSKDAASPGVWVIPLEDSRLSLFRSNAENVLEDTFYNIYSNGKNIEWSPDERQLLIEIAGSTEEAPSQYYIVDLTTNTALVTYTPDIIRQEWVEELTQKREDFIVSIDIPEEMAVIAIHEDTVWAPDNKKFLYKREVEDRIEYRVYNMEKPIPVGEKKDTLVFTTLKSDVQPEVTWYSDSFHLILVENYSIENARGIVNMIRIDGTNKTEVYNSALFSDQVYSAPGGDKLIIVTSFKSGDQTDLYTLGIR